MGFLTLHKLVTFLLAGFGLVALSFGGELTPVSLGVLGAGFVASFFSERALERVPRWPARVTQLLLALLFVQLVRGLLSGAWLGLAMEFSGWLTLSRLANRRSGADYQQVVMLAMVQLISATVLTSDLGFAVLFLGYVVVAPWALSLSHLHVAIERNYPASSDEERGAEARRVLASRRIVGGRFLGAMALLSVPTLFLTLALFLLFPRIGLGFVNLGRAQRESVAGFGDRVELGNFGVIRDDPTIVVRISAGRELARDEQLRMLRLRGTAFDAYDGRRWTRSSSRSTRLASVGDYYPLRRFPGPQDYTLRIALERLDEPVLFLPSGSIGFRIPFRGTPGLSFDSMVVLRGQGFDFRYRAQEEQGLVYEVVVGGLGSDRDLPETDDLDPRARYLGVPSGHGRVVELARELRGDERDPLVIARRFERWLRDEGRFEYTLQQPDTHDRPPLEVFLFEARRGHCEYFATALAIMLRAVDVPARNVTGFIGGEYNAFGGYYAIRQGDAHSWVEAYVPERGWVVLDPTPSASASFAPARGALAGIGDAIDALRTYWALRVVGYDLKEQLRGVRAVSAFFRKFSWFSAREQNGERSAESRVAGLGRTLRGLPWPTVGGALVVLAVVALAWARRRRALAKPLSASVRRVRRLYEQLLRELERRGHTRAAHVTPAQFVAQVAVTDAPAAEVAQAITQAFERVRYGEEAASRAELRALAARLRGLRRAA
jgi:protein-glutamine gamma-glutamyltransferase